MSDEPKFAPMFLPPSVEGRYRPTEFTITKDGWITWEGVQSPETGRGDEVVLCDSVKPDVLLREFVALADLTWEPFVSCVQRCPDTHPSALWSMVKEEVDPVTLEEARVGLEGFVGRLGLLELLDLPHQTSDAGSRERMSFEEYLVGRKPQSEPFAFQVLAGGRQRVEWYWHYASQFRAIKELAAELGKHKTRPVLWSIAKDEPALGTALVLEAWRTRKDPKSDTFGPSTKRAYEIATEDRRYMLREIVDRWLLFGDVRVRCHWDGKRNNPEIGLHTGFAEGGFLGSIALALALSLVRGERGYTVVCFHCRKTFHQERKPRRDQQRHYCDYCRVHWYPDRYRMRDMRQRRAAQKSSRKR